MGEEPSGMQHRFRHQQPACYYDDDDGSISPRSPSASSPYSEPPPPLPPYVPVSRNMALNVRPAVKPPALPPPPPGSDADFSITPYSNEAIGRAPAFSGTATTPKKGKVREVCRDWLVIEDGALAHALQDEEIAAHYGNNRHKNRIVRQDAPHARLEQEDELKQAFAMQQYQQQLREQQEREDAELARQLAEQLRKEDELQARVRENQDEQLASLLQNAAIAKNNRKSQSPDSCGSFAEPSRSSAKMLDLNQPMSEEEAREWQERCDAEVARKLQQDEEEEARFRRDVTDLSRRLAIEAQDRELARMLQEKEKARLRKAKEKAKLKAQQKAAERAELQHEHMRPPSGPPPNPFAPEMLNIAACIDPTWSRRYQHPAEVRQNLPITDLDFPPTAQPVVSGHRRVIIGQDPSPNEPSTIDHQPSSSKSGSRCSHQ